MPVKSSIRAFKWRRLVVVGALLGLGIWVGTVVHRARQQQFAIQAIEDLGATVMYRFERLGETEPPGPHWLRKLIGDEFFVTVVDVAFWNPNTTDEDLKLIEPCQQIESIWLEETQVTDEGLKFLQRFSNLEYVGVYKTKVTRDGVTQLWWELPACWINTQRYNKS